MQQSRRLKERCQNQEQIIEKQNHTINQMKAEMKKLKDEFVYLGDELWGYRQAEIRAKNAEIAANKLRRSEFSVLLFYE